MQKEIQNSVLEYIFEYIFFIYNCIITSNTIALSHDCNVVSEFQGLIIYVLQVYLVINILKKHYIHFSCILLVKCKIY